MTNLSADQCAVINDLNYGYVATLMADGSPHVTPVWVESDSDRLYFTTVHGRLKERNLRRDPRVAIAIVDRHDAEARQVLIRGRVVDIREDVRLQRTDRLAKRYLNLERFPWMAEGQVRVFVTVEPDCVGGSL